jgi:hypothetical protein
MTITESRTSASPIGNTGLNILEVLNHPDLLGEELKGESWSAWHAFMASVFALPMTPEQLEIYKTCTERSTAPIKPFP